MRYLAEFFDQKVEWDGDTRTVSITEDKTLAGNSNLEAWALPMGAMLCQLNGGKLERFGLYSRGFPRLIREEPSGNHSLIPNGACYTSRNLLSSGWSIYDREDLLNTIYSMTYHGHNDSFLYDVSYIKTLSKAEYQQYLSSDGMDSYMFPYTKQLGEKWGDRGILCWDLFRMSNLAQWGYCAGYISYTEALALVGPAALLLKENFSSWDEAYENYLDGYNWWARNNVLGQDVWKTERGEVYLNFKTLENYNAIFNNALFKQAIIPVPNLSAEDII